MAVCKVCFRHCDIPEGKRGMCGARKCENGKVIPANYGRITSLALDPIEKKPLSMFHEGSMILSAGSYGCNLRCPFCQNYQISWSDEAFSLAGSAEYISPEELVSIADNCRNRGNIGIAFTYNEPLIGYEYVRDAARLSQEMGMLNVMVTNGTAELSVLEELAPHIDAMNIDLKGFSDDYYDRVLGGSRKMVMDFITQAVKICHVELTTLIVPGCNDTEQEMRELSAWVSGLTDADGNRIGRKIPLHISRFFPRFNMTDRGPTSVRHIYNLADIAREKLLHVFTGNC